MSYCAQGNKNEYASTPFAKSFKNENVTEWSELVEAAEEGAQAIKVADTAGFEAQQTIHVGQTGADGCEIAVVASVIDETTVNLSAPLERAHSRYEAVTAVSGDRLRVRRAVNVDGKVPSNRSVQPAREPRDSGRQAGHLLHRLDRGRGYWYLLTHWNELTDEETPLDLSAAVCGDDHARYANLDEIDLEDERQLAFLVVGQRPVLVAHAEVRQLRDFVDWQAVVNQSRTAPRGGPDPSRQQCP